MRILKWFHRGNILKYDLIRVLSKALGIDTIILEYELMKKIKMFRTIILWPNNDNLNWV